MIFKTGMQLPHPQHGLVSILDDSGTSLVQVETTDGSIFYTSRASFIEKKKVTKPRAKKPKRVRVVQQVDDTPDLVTDLAARTTGRIELPDGVEESGDESVEEILNEDTVQLDEIEEEAKCEELTTSVTDSEN